MQAKSKTNKLEAICPSTKKLKYAICAKMRDAQKPFQDCQKDAVDCGPKYM